MKKIRNYLAIIALLATLGGFGTGAIANVASSQHTGASFASGHAAKSVAVKHYPPCPILGTDC